MVDANQALTSGRPPSCWVFAWLAGSRAQAARPCDCQPLVLRARAQQERDQELPYETYTKWGLCAISWHEAGV